MFSYFLHIRGEIFILLCWMNFLHRLLLVVSNLIAHVLQSFVPKELKFIYGRIQEEKNIHLDYFRNGWVKFKSCVRHLDHGQMKSPTIQIKMSPVCPQDLRILRCSGRSVPFLTQQRQFTFVTLVNEILLLTPSSWGSRFSGLLVVDTKIFLDC